jgi:hypothetical protein
MSQTQFLKFAIALTMIIALLAAPTSSSVASADDLDVPATTAAPAVRQQSGRSVRKPGTFIHPGLLCSDEDFRRIRAMLEAGREPWKSDWEKLIANRHASLKWEPHPAAVIYRGKARDQTEPENYAQLFNDTAAAYALALRWRISGDPAYGRKAVEILNAWATTLTKVSGSSDACLAAGIYGYQFANAAEIMRSFDGWNRLDFERFQRMMLRVFYPMNADFLTRHNGTKIDHYWCNWDACNMCSMLAIGVLCDKPQIYRDAVWYFKNGKGNGAIARAVYFIHPDGLGQWQESGRDQGHSMMGVGLLATFCQMAWNQGDDLYGYDNNRLLAGAEYVAKYNLGEDVPYRTYRNSDVTQQVIGDGGRGGPRPIWEILYNHYVKLKKLPAPYVTKAAESVRPEGGDGDYGPNSGGYDELGYGTLTFSLY